MDEQKFRNELLKAHANRKRGERSDYWLGYERGLFRGHLGDRFCSEQVHELWLTLARDGIDAVRERGLGYRDGLVVAAAELAA